nr:MAG TPA: hypothetical protein [Caudoviricetes sp.]
MNPTLKPQAYTSKDKAIYDDSVVDLASIILFYLRDSSEATDTDPFNNDSNATSTDLSIFDSSEVSNTDSIFSDSSDVSSMDSSVFIDCSI